MAMITWKDSYSVHHPDMDRQHKKLAATLNELHDALRQGKGKDQLYATLISLIEYTKKHFRDEEALMERVGFPDLEEHRHKHKILTLQVREFAEQYNAGKKTMTVELMNFLRDWLLDHIGKEDAQYGKHLQENS